MKRRRAFGPTGGVMNKLAGESFLLKLRKEKLVEIRAKSFLIYKVDEEDTLKIY